MATTKKAVVSNSVVKKSEAPQKKRAIKKINAEQIQDVYVDGMANLMAGPTTAKISFYTTVNVTEAEETRKMTLRLVMSTDVMIDMVTKLRSSILKNEGSLNSGLESRKAKIFGLVEKLKD